MCKLIDAILLNVIGYWPSICDYLTNVFLADIETCFAVLHHIFASADVNMRFARGRRWFITRFVVFNFRNCICILLSVGIIL